MNTQAQTPEVRTKAAAVDDLVLSSAAEQIAAMDRGAVRSRDLTAASLRRIKRLDGRLNAFRVVFEDQALAAAEEADSRRAGGEQAALLGVPVAIKDDIEQAGEVTTFGTGAADRTSSADSEVLRRLRGAGAVVVGRTKAPELLMWPFAESKTWGVTRNPWDLSRTPGGSSGGSAAAVAAGMVPLALGSDGGGSVRIPAACCGLFGLKTTRGLISIAPHSDADHAVQGLAVYGPLARTVLDAALFLDATAEPDGQAPFAQAAKTEPGRLRIALAIKPPLPCPVDPQVRAATRRVAALLSSLGHTVVEVKPRYLQWVPNFLIRYFAGISYSASALPHPELFERRTRRMAAIGGSIPDRTLAWARRREEHVTNAVGEVFEHADVLLTPTLAGPPVEVGRWQRAGALRTLIGVSRWMPYTPAWNVTGQPAASVPMGMTDSGVPLGVQIVGRMAAERTLLSLAAQIEDAQPWVGDRPSVS